MISFLFSCAFSVDCSNFWPTNFECQIDSCPLESNVTVNCTLSSKISCEGERYLVRSIPCIYCWQLQQEDLKCYFTDGKCKTSPRPQKTVCEVMLSVNCLGPRKFEMLQYCNESRSYSFYTALVLSIFFGGLGADMFYLGYIGQGFGKLFTLGGFGLWSIYDLVRLSIGYLHPQDGSVFSEFNQLSN